MFSATVHVPGCGWKAYDVEADSGRDAAAKVVQLAAEDTGVRASLIGVFGLKRVGGSDD